MGQDRVYFNISPGSVINSIIEYYFIVFVMRSICIILIHNTNQQAADFS